jgi:sugar phosphate isomerase/epimerase
MSLIPISIQLYTLRDEAAKDFPSVLKSLSETGYVGVEFAGLHGHKPSELASMLTDLNLKTSSAHVSLPTKENIAELTDTYKTLGTNLLVSGFGPDEFADIDGVKASAAKFQEAAEVCAANGFSYGIHNHYWEFVTLPDGRLVYDVMLDLAPGAFSELDVYWAEVGGSNPADVIASHRSRLTLLHIKDGPAEHGKKMTAVGHGKLKIPSIIHAANPKVTKWLVVELDECDTDMTQAVKDSYTYLVEQGLAEGNK